MHSLSCLAVLRPFLHSNRLLLLPFAFNLQLLGSQMTQMTQRLAKDDPPSGGYLFCLCKPKRSQPKALHEGNAQQVVKSSPWPLVSCKASKTSFSVISSEAACHSHGGKGRRSLYFCSPIQEKGGKTLCLAFPKATCSLDPKPFKSST